MHHKKINTSSKYLEHIFWKMQSDAFEGVYRHSVMTQPFWNNYKTMVSQLSLWIFKIGIKGMNGGLLVTRNHCAESWIINE
jgi:hypothetical protein